MSIISFTLLMTNKMFSEESLSQAGHKKKEEQKTKKQKKQQSIGIKSFYSNTSYGLEYDKTASLNYLLRCS